MRFRAAAAIIFVFALVVYSAAQMGRPGAAPAAVPDNTIALRATFGYLRIDSANWDGSVTANGGKVVRVEPWRFTQQDAMTDDHSWKLQVKRMVFENQPDRPNPVGGGSGPAQNIVPAGVIVTVERGA